MLHEWMIDVPDRLSDDWSYVFARPPENGVLWCQQTERLSVGSEMDQYCILDQTYYVIDMVCWRGYSLYDCAAEFRFFWLNSKLGETGACDPPSFYHKYKFSTVPVYNCDQNGLFSAYQELCRMLRMDCCFITKLQDDGKLVTSDDPPVVFGCLDSDFIQKSGLCSGNLLRFAISDGGLSFVDGKLVKADLHYLEKPNRARAFADSYSKIMFQHTVRHCPLKVDDLLASISSPDDQQNRPCDIEMVS
ncbi:snurportin-1 [Populus alba x Populus x berolinensis]|uniref:Snurportin-1 n=1 Tax=Populus alba x Populus x berolinensis TaxID=444605 RepID=A0AAD6LP79_9ROSI|nr:snurportin-1 [Populus alba x Populus x berolinensis]